MIEPNQIHSLILNNYPEQNDMIETKAKNGQMHLNPPNSKELVTTYIGGK